MVDHDPPDLHGLDEAEQCKEVYAWAGLALYKAQVIEHGLVNVLAFSERDERGWTPEFSSSDELFDHYFRQVMGRLVTAVKAQIELPDDLEAKLDEALRLRNFIVHRFFRERAELFFHQEGRELMLTELSTTVRRMSELDAELTELVVRLGASYGLTRDLIEVEMERLKLEAGSPGG